MRDYLCFDIPNLIFYEKVLPIHHQLIEEQRISVNEINWIWLDFLFKNIFSSEKYFVSLYRCVALKGNRKLMIRFSI